MNAKIILNYVLELVRLVGSVAYWFQMLLKLLNLAKTKPQKLQKAKLSFHIAYISLKAFAFWIVIRY